jgi:hypothetical protein
MRISGDIACRDTQCRRPNDVGTWGHTNQERWDLTRASSSAEWHPSYSWTKDADPMSRYESFGEPSSQFRIDQASLAMIRAMIEEQTNQRM